MKWGNTHFFDWVRVNMRYATVRKKLEILGFEYRCVKIKDELGVEEPDTHVFRRSNGDIIIALRGYKDDSVVLQHDMLAIKVTLVAHGLVTEKQGRKLFPGTY